MQAQNDACKKYTEELNQHTDMAVQQGSIQLMQQLNAQQNAFIMGVGGSVSAAASDGSFQYGNSQVCFLFLSKSSYDEREANCKKIGMHGSSGSAAAAQAHLLAANMPKSSIPWAHGGVNMVEIQKRMLTEFNAVSAEFIAIE